MPNQDHGGSGQDLSVRLLGFVFWLGDTAVSLALVYLFLWALGWPAWQ